MKKTYPIAILLWCLSNPSFAQALSAKIYLVPWNILTRTSLNAEGVRKLATIKTEITDENLVNKLINYLNEGAFQNIPSSAKPDLRLVIDIRLKNGSLESYSASQFELIEIKSAQTRKIDANFIAHFSSFL